MKVMDVCTCLFSIKVHWVWFHCVTFVLDFVHFSCFPTLLVMFSAERKTSRGGRLNKFKVKSHPSLKDHQALVTNLSLWNLSLSELKYLDKCGLASGIRLMVVSISFCQFPSDNFILCPTIKFLTNCKLRCPPSRLVALKPWAKAKRWKNQTLTLGSKVYNPL